MINLLLEKMVNIYSMCKQKVEVAFYCIEKKLEVNLFFSFPFILHSLPITFPFPIPLLAVLICILYYRKLQLKKAVL